jgi:hypothetical protein
MTKDVETDYIRGSHWIYKWEKMVKW